ncbi:hypothetical protein LTR84_011092 [Exophiala bonariae]|uniref:WW domain-containing protein n=1 Tax=Exophiala bonariae TaxID=1690606 RepID=A0AAV9NKR4_9EURO|nr:hypothetical protein LTR84_011092 [Exophiala bonariae]
MPEAVQRLLRTHQQNLVSGGMESDEPEPMQDPLEHQPTFSFEPPGSIRANQPGRNDSMASVASLEIKSELESEHVMPSQPLSVPRVRRSPRTEYNDTTMKDFRQHLGVIDLRNELVGWPYQNESTPGKTMTFKGDGAEEKSLSTSSSDKKEHVTDTSPNPDEEDGEISDHQEQERPGSSRSPATLEQPDQSNQPNAPPLPKEAPPGQAQQDDGWDALWDEQAQAFYFFNRFTNTSQWDNPRIPEAATQQPPPPGADNWTSARPDPAPTKRVGGYDPSIHGDYDPNADYAKVYETGSSTDTTGAGLPGSSSVADSYAATGSFNRFTGKWQRGDLNPDNFSDEQKSRRQMNAFFDVDAAANSHDGKSLRAERANKKLSKAELKAFKEKRREKKEEKRRAWLRD